MLEAIQLQTWYGVVLSGLFWTIPPLLGGFFWEWKWGGERRRAEIRGEVEKVLRLNDDELIHRRRQLEAETMRLREADNRRIRESEEAVAERERAVSEREEAAREKDWELREQEVQLLLGFGRLATINDARGIAHDGPVLRGGGGGEAGLRRRRR
jgi:hypothetical protein